MEHMMKPSSLYARLARLLGLGLAAFLSIASLPAQAVIGTLDNVPAATLLMPYFEVDLTSSPTYGDQGVSTSLRVSNASATAVLAHVTLWTDRGVPTYSFNMYLTGYDTTDIDMRLLFKGILPRTASAGQDPMDTITPQGQSSQDINFASCTGTLPHAGLLDTATVTALRNAHTGQASSLTGGQCGGDDHGDNIARGYVTLNTVNQCYTGHPGTPGYFGAGGTGVATNQNVLVGTVTWTHPANNFSASDPAIHIEASPGVGVAGFQPASPITSTPGEATPTFYGRLVNWLALDNREPLGSVWQARYINGGAFSGGTTLQVWRDPGTVVNPTACGLPAAPLGHQQAVAFDEQENYSVLAANTFPRATQSVRVGPDLNPPYSFGFLHLNLNAANGTPRQAVVSVRHDADGRFSGSMPGSMLFRAGEICVPWTPTPQPGDHGDGTNAFCNYYAPTIYVP
jgi:hypothetical protein